MGYILDNEKEKAVKKLITLVLPLMAVGCGNGQQKMLDSLACEGVANDFLSATYIITDDHQSSHQTNQSNQRTFQLIRQSETEVLHITGQNNISEKWNRLNNGSARPVRYFDNHQRAIEYQPEDLSVTTGSTNWQAKYQLLAEQALAGYQLTSTVGQGCKQVQYYHAKIDDASLDLAWLPQLDLLFSYTINSPEGEISWQLTDLNNNSGSINQAFAQRELYLSTDFADIGDNESDPFLLQMINLGFIEHGASGFYNADGEDIGGEHSHGGQHSEPHSSDQHSHAH